MSQTIKKTGIILSSREYKDNARMIKILTSNGVEDLILRGANKIESHNKKYTIVPLYVDYVSNLPKPLITFIEGYIKNSFTNIKTDQTSSLVYLNIVEKINAFYMVIDSYKLFYEFVLKTLELLNESSHQQLVQMIFEIKLWYLLGIQPPFNSCVKCGNPINNISTFGDVGGIFCSECLKEFPKELLLNDKEFYVIKTLYSVKLDKIDEEFFNLIKSIDIDLIKLDSFIDYYYDIMIDFRSKTKKIIKQII